MRAAQYLRALHIVGVEGLSWGPAYRFEPETFEIGQIVAVT